jgi:hypothetical protein
MKENENNLEHKSYGIAGIEYGNDPLNKLNWNWDIVFDLKIV